LGYNTLDDHKLVAEATMLNPKFSGLEYNSMARMDLRDVKAK
jgi:hypothetical protein